MKRSLRALAVVAATAAALLPLQASAQPRPDAQHVITRGSVGAPPRRAVAPKAALAAHWRFGTIVQLGATTFTLHTRSGKTLTVDASVPIQSGLYSYPLYVGKPVVVEGTFDSAGTLHATSVTRAIRIDRLTPADKG